MIIPVLGKTVVTGHNDKDSRFGGAKTEYEVETKGSFSIGFIGAIGYGYSLSDNMTIFGEVEYIGLSIKSGSATFTKYDVAGKDQLANMKTAQKEYEFVDEIDSSTTPNMDKPTQMLKQKAPFSSLGFNIGITMTF
jgi:hypothetical protein